MPGSATQLGRRGAGCMPNAWAMHGRSSECIAKPPKPMWPISVWPAIYDIPGFPDPRESEALGTVCRFREWNQSAQCSAPMCF
jgi:hypothetical protein